MRLVTRKRLSYPVLSSTSTVSCTHRTLRALDNGHCVLCDGARALTYEEECAELELEQARADAKLAALDSALMRLDFAEYCKGAWTQLEPMELEWNWHHDALCVNLQGLYEEFKKRKRNKKYVMKWQKLIMNICPSSLKSRIVMVLFVSWVWLDDPTFKWLCCSINPTNVIRDSEDCRLLIKSRWYRQMFNIPCISEATGKQIGKLVNWDVAEDIDNKGKFQLTTGGERISRGLLAKHTGIHVHGILVDDPDDAFDVHSEAERKRRAGKMESLMSRVSDKRHSFYVVIQQRVHIDDCSGELLARGGWVHANYALEYHANTRHDSPWYNDPRTKDGEVLQPERFTSEVIAALRVEYGIFGFEAQCNGNPTAGGGGMLPLANWRFCRIEGQAVGDTQRPTGAYTGAAKLVERDSNSGWLKLDWLALTVDCTFGSISDTASNVGLLALGGKGPDRYCFDDRTKARNYPDTKRDLRQMIIDWKPHFSSLRVLIEKKANGQAVIDELSQEFGGLIPLEVEGGKEARAYAMSADVDSGKAHVLDGAPWMPRHLGIVSIFPHGKTDDEVDCWSQAMAYYREPTDAMKLLAKNAAFKGLARARINAMARG